MLRGTTFSNSNGRTYEVVRWNEVKCVAVLKSHRPTFKNLPYVVAKGFKASKSSWDNGTYDLTEVEANSIYYNS